MGDTVNQSTRGKRLRKPRARPLDTAALELRADIEKNSEAIQKLQELPGKLDEVLAIIKNQQQLDDSGQPLVENQTSEACEDAFDHEDVVNDAMDNDEEAINDLLLKANAGHVDISNANDGDASLIDILNISQPSNEYGSPLQSDVAESITRLYKNDASTTMLDKLKEKYLIPENCKHLGTPKINAEIWPSLPQRTRQHDYHLQQQQNQLTIASVANARIAESLFSTKLQIDQSLRQDLLKSTMEAATEMAHVSTEISKRRKLEIKPVLNPEYASICSNQSSETWLFGDNLAETMKNSKSTSQIMKASVSRPAFTRGQRQNPYRTTSMRGNLNFLPPSQRMRGGNGNRFMRGRPWRAQTRGRPNFLQSQNHQK